MQEGQLAVQQVVVRRKRHKTEVYVMDRQQAEAKGAREARALAMRGTTAFRANRALARSLIFARSAVASTSAMLAQPVEHD